MNACQRTAIAIVLSSLIALAAIAPLHNVVMAQDALITIDGRSIADDVVVVEFDEATLAPAIEQARAYWRSRDNEYEEDVRIMDFTHGAFTREGITETAVLYMMSPWPRCCPKTGIAILSEGQVRLNVAFEGTAQTLLPLPDIDGDALSDIGLVGTFGSGGSNSTSLTIASLRNSHVDVWTETIISDDSCAAGYEGRHAAIIDVWPGPTFTGRNLHSSACDGNAWDETDGDAYFGDPRPAAEEFVILSSID